MCSCNLIWSLHNSNQPPRLTQPENPFVDRHIEYQQKLGSKQTHFVMVWQHKQVSCEDQINRNQFRLNGSRGLGRTLLFLLTPTVVAWVQRSSASVCDSVCPHDKTKTAETKIAKLGTEIVHHNTLPTGHQGHRSGSQGQKVATRQPCGAILLHSTRWCRTAGMNYALYWVPSL